MAQKRFGFSTGALEKGDYRKALQWMLQHQMQYVELSALRYDELEPLINDLDTLPVKNLNTKPILTLPVLSLEKRKHVVSLLEHISNGWNIVHPDVIYTPSRWRHFGRQLLPENMDCRKQTGRTVPEISRLLGELSHARLCLEVAHARQLDTTLSLLWSFTTKLKDRIAVKFILANLIHAAGIYRFHGKHRGLPTFSRYAAPYTSYGQNRYVSRSYRLRHQELQFYLRLR